jgi:predicted TIM-barrel fold metal-dependent hydrolase
MAIDFHAHLARENPDAPPFMRDLFDVEGYLEKQEQAGLELTVLSYALSEPSGTDAELEEAKAEHEFLAGLVETHAGRFAALAGVNPFDGGPWLEEAERALDAGFSGLCFPTSVNGKYLDDPEAEDAFALADARGVPIFLHPSTSPVGVDRLGQGVLVGWVGRPYDTGICLTRMLLADTLSRYPNVRMVVAHCGGVLPMLLGRIDHVYQGLQRMAAAKAKGGGPPGGGPPGGGPPGGGPPGGGPPMGGGNLEASLEGDPPSQRLGQLVFDTASYHPAAIKAAIEAVGVENMVVGTDFPPAGDSPGPSIADVDRVGLTPEEKEKIMSENARGLLGATVQGGS